MRQTLAAAKRTDRAGGTALIADGVFFVFFTIFIRELYILLNCLLASSFFLFSGINWWTPEEPEYVFRVEEGGGGIGVVELHCKQISQFCRGAQYQNPSYTHKPMYYSSNCIKPMWL